jgi:hypothetical protein
MTGPEDPDADDVELIAPEPAEDEAAAIEEEGEPGGDNFV